MALRRVALAVAARAVVSRLDQDQLDRCHPNPIFPLCRGPARYADRRVKTFVRVLGSLTLERAYFDWPLVARDPALVAAGSAWSIPP